MKTRVDSAAIVIVGVLAFWTGIWLAALDYPAAFDWCFVTISSLGYPDRNPVGHGWASAGIWLCGLLGAFWSVARAMRSRAEGGSRALAGLWTLAVGFGAMACAGLLPERFLAVPKGHQILALTAFFCLCIGTARLSIDTISRRRGRDTRGGAARFAVPAAAWAAGPLAPIALAGATQLYLAVWRPELPWVTPAWRALGVPLYLSFAFWEWLACAVFSAYLVTLALGTAPCADSARP